MPEDNVDRRFEQLFESKKQFQNFLRVTAEELAEIQRALEDTVLKYKAAGRGPRGLSEPQNYAAQWRNSVLTISKSVFGAVLEDATQHLKDLSEADPDTERTNFLIAKATQANQNLSTDIINSEQTLTVIKDFKNFLLQKN